MNKMGKTVVAVSLFLLLAGAARAEVTLNSARIGAVDVEKLAKFYQAAFGLHEVSRIQLPSGPEIFLNFGATPEAAKANKSLRVVIMPRDTDAIKDPVPHLIFNVTDMAATAAAVKAAGGSMDGEPRPFGNTGMVIGFAVDPVGNRIELIQARKPAQ